MARTSSNVPPAYPLKPHRRQARITVRLANNTRQDLYLGPHGSPESYAEYRRVLAELEAHGGAYPVPVDSPADDLTVNELILEYWRWAEEHYRDPDGNPARELANMKDALRPLRRLYGETAARSFGPTALRTLQQEMVKDGLCRSVVNSRINRIRRVFKWAVSFERRTKRTPSEMKRHRKRTPKVQPGTRYNRRSYRWAVVRACWKANVPEWCPLQLRPTAATLIRAKYGVEAAKAILGHSRVETSQIYAERDEKQAAQIIAEIG